MGDRCTVNIKFGGPVTEDQANELLLALKGHQFVQDWGDDPSELTIEDLDETLHAEEVNYANIEDVELICRMYGIAYEKWNSAGGDYGEQIERYLDGTRMSFPCADGEALVPLSEVLKVETLASGMAKLIEQARFRARPFSNFECA